MVKLFPGEELFHGTTFALNDSVAKSMTAENMQSRFRTCGIYFFDPSAVLKDVYLPNLCF